MFLFLSICLISSSKGIKVKKILSGNQTKALGHASQALNQLSYSDMQTLKSYLFYFRISKATPQTLDQLWPCYCKFISNYILDFSSACLDLSPTKNDTKQHLQICVFGHFTSNSRNRTRALNKVRCEHLHSSQTLTGRCVLRDNVSSLQKHC